MVELTDAMNQYRECSRLVWNLFLRTGADGPTALAFDSIREVLFAEIVLGALQAADYRRARPSRALPFIEVVPLLEETPIMIKRRDAGAHGYWDDPTKRVGLNDATFAYIDCFDWDQMGHREFRYLVVEITAWKDKPELVGRQALIEAQDTRTVGYAELVVYPQPNSDRT